MVTVAAPGACCFAGSVRQYWHWSPCARAGAGAGLLAWALLPSGALLYAYGDSGPLTLLVGTTLLAALLRAAVNLPLAVLASVPVGFLTGLGVAALGGEYLDQIVAVFGDFIGAMEQQLSQGPSR